MKPKTITQHESQYWHIPKFSLLPIIGLILFSLLAYGNYFLIDKQVVITTFNCKEGNCNLVPNDLIIIYPIVGEYILISLIIISFVAVIKKGYNNLKSYEEDGLIAGLIFASIVSLILGLTFSFALCLIHDSIASLIIGSIIASIASLIFSSITGLILEFEE